MTVSQHLRLAQKLMAKRRNRDAIRVLSTYTRSHPDDSDAVYLLGTAAYRTGDHALAATAFRRVTQTWPNDAREPYSLGLALTRARDSVEARRWFEEALRRDPALQRARDRLAELGPISQLPEATAVGTGPEVPVNEHLEPGRLMRSGRRRPSSFLGQICTGVALGVIGSWLLIDAHPGRLRWLAERLVFPSPDVFRSELADTRGTPLEASVRHHLAAALTAVERRSTQLDNLLTGLLAIMIVAGVLILLHAVGSAILIRYDVFQRRIDISRGVLFRRWTSTWLYEITDVHLVQTPLLSLTGNCNIKVSVEGEGRKDVHIVGFGSRHDQHRLWQELRDQALRERREMRRWWV